jgi:hypothetical protein
MRSRQETRGEGGLRTCPATSWKRGKGRGPGDPGDDDAGVLERLAERLEQV